MTVKVKICGLKSDAAMAAALDHGADFVGLVFYPPSPRAVSPGVAALLASQARGRAQTVALLVDPDDVLLDVITGTVYPDIIQLHGNETPQRVEDIRRRCTRPVFKALRVATSEDVAGAYDYKDKCDLILFDAKPPPDGVGILPGGNGIPFDWRILADIRYDIRYMLSGGLTADNVADAIALTGARAVDVSSGVESSPGVKDAGLIARFIAAAKRTDADEDVDPDASAG